MREKFVNAAGTLATGLTDDMRSLLLEAATAPKAEDREIAVRALLMFAPKDMVSALLDKTRKEDRETRVRVHK